MLAHRKKVLLTAGMFAYQYRVAQSQAPGYTSLLQPSEDISQLLVLEIDMLTSLACSNRVHSSACIQTQRFSGHAFSVRH